MNYRDKKTKIKEYLGGKQRLKKGKTYKKSVINIFKRAKNLYS